MRKSTHGVRFWAALTMTLDCMTPTHASRSEGSGEELPNYMLGRVDNGFSGAVLVVQGSEVLLRGGYGHADIELDVRNTPDTVFRIGSLSKPFLAAAVLRLVARGRLGRDSPLRKYIPNAPRSWSAVRIRDLLSHTSGIADFFSEVESGAPAELRELVDDTLSRVAGSPLESEPGTAYAYNNFGYLLLAYIVEVAENAPWSAPGMSS